MTGIISTTAGSRQVPRTLDARRDTLDFRDRMFETSLVEVPTHLPLAHYRSLKVPVLDQGQEGACTGFGLATVANYLLLRRKVEPDKTPVSARMLYEMARRYDEWPGENYSGSSARGAMKGWHKHGVCRHDIWPDKPKTQQGHTLTQERGADAVQRPLGAYLRVNHKDLVAMHCALAQVGVLYATAVVHEGWSRVDAGGTIPYPAAPSGGHAFAIVAYDSQGFWIQNSWGQGWGMDGFARIGYDDWLANGTDVWVARLGAPVQLRMSESTAITKAPGGGQSSTLSHADLRPHVVSLGNQGALRPSGEFGTSAEQLREIFESDMPRIMANWRKPHVLLYAHGGLVDERSAIQRLAEYRSAMLDQHIYPISFVWHSDYWSTLTHMLQDALRTRRPEGALGPAKDFLLDRLDDTVEVLSRALTGKSSWDEMKENALGASARGGGAQAALEHLAALHKRMPFKLHLVGHSAGSIFLAPLVRLLTCDRGKIASGYLRGRQGLGMQVDTCTLWAPACTSALFKQAYLPAVRSRAIARMAAFVLDDHTEQGDNVAGIYNKSLLYLVSRAFEESATGPGTPILGMEKWIAADPLIAQLFTGGAADLVFSPNDHPEGSMHAARACEHGAFDDDIATVKATLARILHGGADPAQAAPRSEIVFRHGGSALRSRREKLDRA